MIVVYLFRFLCHSMCLTIRLMVRAFVRLTVRETLTFRAFERERRTFPVADLTGVELEVPFHKVARKVGFAD